MSSSPNREHIQGETQEVQQASNADGAPASAKNTNDSSGDSSESGVRTISDLLVPGVVPTPADAAKGGREINRQVLHVGGIDQKVTETMLLELFKVTGQVLSIKVFPDKNRHGFVYAFIEYDRQQDAEMAFNTLNCRVIHDAEIKINWAYQSQQAIKDSENFNLFVGDLATEVNDEMLANAFTQHGYNSIIEARVMWDMTTGRSRGYGFVSFTDKDEAENAIAVVNHQLIGTRNVRVNWAEKKISTNTNPSNIMILNMNQSRRKAPHHQNKPPLGHYGPFQPPHPAVAAAAYQAIAASTPIPGYAPMTPDMHPYEVVLSQAPAWQSTVYIGNLPTYTNTADLIPILQNLGYVVGFKHQPDRGYAFVQYDSHEIAAMAIVQLSNFQIGGRALKVGWGKSRQSSSSAKVGPPQ